MAQAKLLFGAWLDESGIRRDWSHLTSEYQEIISRCLQKLCYHQIATVLRPSTNQCLMQDSSFVEKIKKWYWITIMIWESFLGKTVDSDVLKKNINTPSLLDLRGERTTGMKRPELKLTSSKTLHKMHILRLKKHPLILKKPHLTPKKPKIMLKKTS